LWVAPIDVNRFLPYSLLLQAILGLLLVEQVFRNHQQSERWTIKHFCLGIGAIFAYDLFFYSDTILLQRVDANLSQARGLVTAIAIPLIAVSIARTPRWSLEIHVSRTVVFHSATLLGSGIYLMAMALAGYSVRAFSGTWGATLQIAFLIVAGLFLLTLLFSSHIRARLRILLSEHFFSFKYDYRSEWRRFPEPLAEKDTTTTKSIILALGSIVGSPGGLLWVRTEHNNFECVDHIKAETPKLLSLPENDPLIAFMRDRGWIVDLTEMQFKPDHYPGVDPPAWALENPQLWLCIPLFFQSELIGVALLTQSAVVRHVNWEDRSLLKTAGLQAAGILAQHLADRALVRARQFEAFNQLASYVAHDLKNLIAQQSLIVANAERHKSNPEFVEDVIRTIGSSVQRMEKLMLQLRYGRRDLESKPCSLTAALIEATNRLGPAKPIPVLTNPDQDIRVIADEEHLVTSLGHLLKNAQEATSSDGHVGVEVLQDGEAAVVRISDDGVGMSQDFINNRLFKPFDSTKGLTGMGIGAFESREYFHILGGDLQVTSKPGEGSVFTAQFPCLAQA
jgi:putative PEP-CTERM system histidine kinase